DADAARGKGLKSELGQMIDRRPLADAADDHAAVDGLDEFSEKRIVLRIVAHDRVLDRGNRTVLDETSEVGRLDVAFVFYISDHRLAVCFGDLADADCDSGRR